MTGCTLKQYAAKRFYAALDEYREALASGDSQRIIRTSIGVHVAQRDNRDRSAVNRVFRESHGLEKRETG